MKTTSKKLILTAAMCIAATFHPGSLLAQAPPGQPPPAAPTAPLLSPDQLQTLVGRVALYPDDLLALVLPASTTPLDIVKAQRFLAAQEKDKSRKPDPSISQPVVNLLTYPDVIALMGNDLDWTEALGNAVTAQQLDVLQAIQIFRRKAQAAGNLKTDDKQVVVVKQDVVQIVPAKPDVIYVPQYQPATVVVAQPVPAVTYVATPYPTYYRPVAAAAAVATVAYGLNWYGGGIYHAPYAAHYDHIQDQRMDYANNAREDWQDYGKASREDWQKHANEAQSQRQQTSTANQTQRQQSAQQRTSANQTQRQEAASGAQSQRATTQGQRQSAAQGNQAQRQSAASGSRPQGAQSWQGASQSRQGGQGQGARSGSSAQFGGRQSGGGSGGSAFSGMSSGSRSQSFSQRGGASRSSMSRGGGRRR
jgi:hypothetical protein